MVQAEGMREILIWKRSFEVLDPDTNERRHVYMARVPADYGLTICDFCVYGPPSSFDGKPCTMCPAEIREDIYVDE